MTTVRNLARLQRKLTQIPLVAKTAIRAQMAIVADDIVAMMKRLVPVNRGTLRDSIGWTWGKAPKGAAVVAAVKSGGASDMVISIYAGDAEAYYARWLEFGTQKMPAQPYFYVSWRANKRSAVRRISKATRDAAKKVAAQS